MTEPAKDVCVIGAKGALGRLAVKGFASAGWKVHPAGRRPEPGRGFRWLDLDQPETVSTAIEGTDLVVNTVPPPGLTAEWVVLERGGTLLNCSHAPGAAAASLGAEAADPKGTVLLNAGLVPGATNLVAAALLEECPEADCLEIAFTARATATAGKAGMDFAHHGLTSQRHHRVVELPLPEPFGRLKCIEVAEAEDGGFGGVAGSRNVENYLGFDEQPLHFALRAANALRLMSLLPRAAFPSRPPKGGDASREPVAIWVGARRGPDRLGASVLECEGDYRSTAAAARVFGDALLAEPRPPGCFNPEDLFGLDELQPAFEDFGVKITRQWKAG